MLLLSLQCLQSSLSQDGGTNCWPNCDKKNPKDPQNVDRKAPAIAQNIQNLAMTIFVGGWKWNWKVKALDLVRFYQMGTLHLGK